MTMFIPGIRLRTNEAAGGTTDEETTSPESETTQGTAETPPAGGWTGPTQEEWQQSQAALRAIASRFLDGSTSAPPVQEAPPDDDDVDIDEYIQRQVDSRLAPYQPAITAAQLEQGKKNLNQLHDRFEKELNKKFDRNLAESLAHRFMNETNDPIAAVKAGVEEAIRIQDEYSTKAVEEYKKSLKRGPHDLEPGAGAGGDRQIPAAESYDEVIDKWSAQTEV